MTHLFIPFFSPDRVRVASHCLFLRAFLAPVGVGDGNVARSDCKAMIRISALSNGACRMCRDVVSRDGHHARTESPSIVK